MKVYNCSSPADAIRAIEKEMGIIIVRDEEYQEPIIDLEKAYAFVEYAHKNLIENYELREYYSQKRKIFNMSTILNHKLGFIEKHKFPYWGSWELTGWVIPVTNCRGEIIAVKIHNEKRLRTQPKCIWAPFGTYPSDKPKNGTLTLWPPPELFTNKNFLIIAPGELKALALIDAGYNATSPTAGESKLPERILKRIEALHFGKIFINYDNDPTGKDFKDILIKGLSALGIMTIPFTYSSKLTDILPKNESEISENEPENEPEKNSDIESINKEWVLKNLEDRVQKTLTDGVIPEDAELFTNQLSLEDKKAWFKNNQK
jgi:hypothetical protein